MNKPDFTVLNASNIIAFIEDIFERCGAESYLGEDVSMAEHMLQGAQLAEQAGANEEMITATLLHDIGHYTSEFPADMVSAGVDNHHDTAGADILAPFFPQIVTDCVRYHVAAKRFLCATKPSYASRLSQASVDTLKLQGGPMNEDEVATFRQIPDHKAILRVRIWDDEGKKRGVETPPLAHYVPVLQRVVDAHCGGT